MPASRKLSRCYVHLDESNKGQKSCSTDADALFAEDSFRMFCFKILPCAKRTAHDWTHCPFAHPNEKARRRDPRVYPYLAIPCPEVKENRVCKAGDSCPYAHSVFEYWLHPSRYRTQLCQHGTKCRRSICFFAHTTADLRVPDLSQAKGAVASSASDTAKGPCDDSMTVKTGTNGRQPGNCTGAAPTNVKAQQVQQRQCQQPKVAVQQYKVQLGQQQQRCDQQQPYSQPQQQELLGLQLSCAQLAAMPPAQAEPALFMGDLLSALPAAGNRLGAVQPASMTLPAVPNHASIMATLQAQLSPCSLAPMLPLPLQELLPEFSMSVAVSPGPSQADSPPVSPMMAAGCISPVSVLPGPAEVAPLLHHSSVLGSSCSLDGCDLFNRSTELLGDACGAAAVPATTCSALFCGSQALPAPAMSINSCTLSCDAAAGLPTSNSKQLVSYGCAHQVQQEQVGAGGQELLLLGLVDMLLQQQQLLQQQLLQQQAVAVAIAAS